MDTHDFGGSLDKDQGGVEAGMPGTGTNYARRVGIIEHIRGTVTQKLHGVRALLKATKVGTT